MTFASVMSNAWKEFTDNFVSILIFIALFYFVPLVIIIVLFIVGIFSLGLSSGIFEGTGSFSVLGVVIISIIAIIAFVIFVALMVFIYAGFYGLNVKKRKYSWKEIVSVAKCNFWKMLGRGILFMLVLMVLYLLLIIPGIIFSIYFIFSAFIWFNEPSKGFIYSLKKSMQLVRGRWWKTFGYVLLAILLTFVITLISSFIPFVGSLVNVFVGFFLIYFFRHLYIEYSSKKK